MELAKLNLKKKWAHVVNISFMLSGLQNISLAFVMLTELQYFGLADIKLKPI